MFALLLTLLLLLTTTTMVTTKTTVTTTMDIMYMSWNRKFLLLKNIMVIDGWTSDATIMLQMCSLISK
jgi:hypothetical protein